MPRVRVLPFADDGQEALGRKLTAFCFKVLGWGSLTPHLWVLYFTDDGQVGR